MRRLEIRPCGTSGSFDFPWSTWGNVRHQNSKDMENLSETKEMRHPPPPGSRRVFAREYLSVTRLLGKILSKTKDSALYISTSQI
jgi:hypothetical protein